MNFEELSAMDAAAQVGLDGLGTKPTVRISLSMQENRVLSNLASFFGFVTAGRQGAPSQPKVLSALRMMTAGDEAGRSFWGPNGIITKSLASFRAAVTELRALVARQAAAITSPTRAGARQRRRSRRGAHPENRVLSMDRGERRND